LGARLDGIEEVAGSNPAGSTNHFFVVTCSWTSYMYPELQRLEEEYSAVEADARSLLEGLTDERGAWRPADGVWSVAECFDHLAITNQVYVRAMRPVAEEARRKAKLRRGPAKPGFFGGIFVRALEPPAKMKGKAPAVIRPRAEVKLGDAAADFFAAHAEAKKFLEDNADLDLAAIRFINPFIKGLRFSLATGLHAIPAHERRHLYQARHILNQIAR
jgi:DinB superfamily